LGFASSRRIAEVSMIDRLQNIARALAGLAVPSLVLAAVLLGYAVFIVFTSSSHEDDRFLFPSILGFAWALSLYGFIETFRQVPERLDRDAGLWRRTRRRLSRFWYGLMAVAFFIASSAVLVLSLRTLSVWFGSYPAEEG
jgi:hypothetical protein